MKNRLICTILICSSAWLLNANAQDCEHNPMCIAVELSFASNAAPTVNRDRLTVPAGGSFDVELVKGSKALMIFSNGKTPLVNQRGAEVYSVKLKHLDNKKLYVKDSCDASCEYKYSILDTENPERPILDPVIIIER